MPATPRPAKAQLVELTSQFKPKDGGKKVTVQFNPESLKVNFANQIVPPSNSGDKPAAGDQSNPAGTQFVGAGTTKLTLLLWFDVNAPLPDTSPGVIDVRELTKEVAYFITPQQTSSNPPVYVPPAVQFVWGSFHFDGIVESLEESLDFFSDEGVPLRASVSLSISQQQIQTFSGKQGAPPGAGFGPGTRPLAQATAGASLQAMADLQGQGDNWQGIAAANGIENPRLLAPGQLIDLNASVSLSA